MERRTLLKLLSLSALTPTVLQQALAREVEDKNFLVVITLPGGWDTTLGLDPWTDSKLPQSSDLFLEYGANDIFRSGGISLGPAAQPLSGYASQMAILNGIFLSETDNGHNAAEKYMLTGDTGMQNSMVLSLADALNLKDGLGVLTNNSLVRVNAKSPSSSITGVSRAFKNKLTGSEYSYFAAKQTHNSAFVKALKQMVTNAPNMKQLFQALEDNNYNGETSGIDSAVVVASAFKSNSSHFAELRIESQGGSFDTHSSHEKNHLKSQKETFIIIKNILDLFKKLSYGDNGESLFDRTTFMITSEFSRTAALNNAKGKDHNPMTNSAVFIGNGIKGNKVIGASRLVTREKSKIGMSYQIGMPYDYSAGEVIRSRINGSQFITPKNILRTLCDVVKVDPASITGLDINTPVLKELLS